MRFSSRLILLTALLFAALTPPAEAQYMYIDANRDGVWSSADRLNPDTTTVLVWLNTNHDRDGSTRVCNDHTSAASTTTTLNVFGYDLVFHAAGGTVAYSSFASPGFSANGSEFQTDTDATIHRRRPLGSTLAGLQLLGYMTVMVVTGSPAISVANGTSIDPAAYGTGFGTDCNGSDFANTYVLGTDWFDADGVEPPSGDSRAGSSTINVSGSGSIFLGGTEIPGPWVLASFGRRLVVNGFTLPAEDPEALRHRLSPERQAQLDFIDRAEILADSLRRSALSVGDATERLRRFCASNGLGGTVEAQPGLVSLKFPSGANMLYTLKPIPLAPDIGTPSPPGTSQGARLEQIARLLRRGALVFILNRSSQIIIPAVRAQEARAAIRKLRSGASLDPGEDKLLPARIRAQIQTPVRLVRL